MFVKFFVEDFTGLQTSEFLSYLETRFFRVWRNNQRSPVFAIPSPHSCNHARERRLECCSHKHFSLLLSYIPQYRSLITSYEHESRVTRTAVGRKSSLCVNYLLVTLLQRTIREEWSVVSYSCNNRIVLLSARWQLHSLRLTKQLVRIFPSN